MSVSFLAIELESRISKVMHLVRKQEIDYVAKGVSYGVVRCSFICWNIGSNISVAASDKGHKYLPKSLTTMKKNRLSNEAHDMRKIPHIPQDIFQEILSRLPVKTLMRFKSVCKSWKTLISHPNFSKLHLEKSVDQNRTRFMFLHDYFQCTLAYAPPDGTSETNNKPINTNESNGCVDFLASCNGLFCVGNAKDEIFLWNPSTRESKKIPGSKIEFPRFSNCTWASVFFGLGYDSTSDDYKLVRVSMFDTEKFQTEVKIYSRNNNTWKRIRDFPYDFPIGRPGVFVCGGLHWIVSLWCNTVKMYMISVLNLEDENYGLIRLPEFGQEVRFFEIGTLGENLVLFCCYFEFRYDIWILENYGKTETWTRINIVTSSLNNIEAFVYFEPLCLLSPDEILIRIGAKRFVMYDVKSKQCSDFLVPNMIKESRIVSF
ncbi:hypothetical protein DH2020_003600 [Rehmannia glutinosa]|uniref:F-box domain-containing protein n=1 Tax=Rehmannia glutinosa TaxID=99300 RepID=A0ABR0XM52_REHGL